MSYSPTLELNSPMNVNHRMENAPPTLRGARRAVTSLWTIIQFYRAFHILHDEELFSIFLDKISYFDIRQFFKNEKKNFSLKMSPMLQILQTWPGLPHVMWQLRILVTSDPADFRWFEWAVTCINRIIRTFFSLWIKEIELLVKPPCM